MAGQFDPRAGGGNTRQGRSGALSHADQTHRVGLGLRFGLALEALIPEQGQPRRLSHGAGGCGGIQAFDGHRQGQVAGTGSGGGLAGGGAGLTQAGQGEIGGVAQPHQDQGVGVGVEPIQAEAFTRFGLEAPPLQPLSQPVGQGRPQGGSELGQLGVIGPVFSAGEQADGQAVAAPGAQSLGQGVGDAAKLHGSAGGGGDRSQRTQLGSAWNGVAQRPRVSLLNGGSQRRISACSRARRGRTAVGTSSQKRMLSWQLRPAFSRASL